MLPTHVFGSPVPGGAQGGSQVVAYTGTQGVSTALTQNNNSVRLCATTDCFVEFGLKDGSTPTAAPNTSLFLPANRPEYFEVAKGCKIAVIQSAAGGNLFITQF